MSHAFLHKIWKLKQLVHVSCNVTPGSRVLISCSVRKWPYILWSLIWGHELWKCFLSDSALSHQQWKTSSIQRGSNQQQHRWRQQDTARHCRSWRWAWGSSWVQSEWCVGMFGSHAGGWTSLACTDKEADHFHPYSKWKGLVSTQLYNDSCKFYYYSQIHVEYSSAFQTMVCGWSPVGTQRNLGIIFFSNDIWGMLLWHVFKHTERHL